MSGFQKQTRTITTLEALAAAVWSAWPEAEPIDVAILYGKIVAECGWPGPKQALWNWNLGNVRGTSAAGNYTLLGSAYEIVDANKVPAGWHVVPNTFGASVPAGKVCVLPDNPSEAQRFRAYDSLQEAVVEYLAVLGKSFRAAWAELFKEGSDPAAFVLALKAGHYFTGDPTAYIVNVKAGVSKAMPVLSAMPRPSDAPDTEPSTPTSKSGSMRAVDPGTAPDDWRPAFSVDAALDLVKGGG